MNYIANSSGLLDDTVSSEGLSWSDPLGLGVFIVAIALTLALLSWTIKNLSSIEAQQNRRKK